MSVIKVLSFLCAFYASWLLIMVGRGKNIEFYIAVGVAMILIGMALLLDIHSTP